MTGSLAMNNLLRFQGLAVYAMIGITTGGILNMILDPIFIFGLDLGISGAALATALSQCISFGILFFQSLLRKDCVHLKPGKTRFLYPSTVRSFTAGSRPSAVRGSRALRLLR